MRRIVLLYTIIVSLLTSAVSAKQPQTQGTIDFVVTLALRKQLAAQNPMLANLLPEYQKMYKTLVFKNDSYSITDKMEPMKLTGNTTNTIHTTQVAQEMQNNRQLLNTKTGICRTEYVFKKHDFYTEETFKPLGAITYLPETRLILGYTCHKAVIMREGKKSYAWYTNDFACNYMAEPGYFAGIKGTVLEYASDVMTIRAMKVTPAYNPAAVTAKSPSKKITAEQVKDLQEEAMEDMKGQLPVPANGQPAPQNAKTIRITL